MEKEVNTIILKNRIQNIDEFKHIDRLYCIINCGQLLRDPLKCQNFEILPKLQTETNYL
jgi:hypothetical protein